ncbi:MAG: hypothetical protein JNK48_12725, partial [Bryobacterales bacterium]|nr:hypothetical protein [Bryobacterales bacterium]
MIAATQRAIEAVWRTESARLIAGVARMVRDIGVAEELAQDALVSALQRWPAEGIPRNPGAWLMAAAKFRAIDHLRRNKVAERGYEQMGLAMEERERRVSDLAAMVDDDIGDDLLRLMF